ncbi:MAG: M14 family zinc carboxypeptidase, partial [Bacteroidales bacterium]|nr:M14 family zinc carboxypeptidase [Bacteroidales bacterium]
MKNLTLGLLFLLSSSLLFGQVSDEMEFANQTLETRGEFYFTFTYDSKDQVIELLEFLSIDKVVGTTVYAYANTETFEIFKNYNIDFERVHDYYNTSKALTMATTVAQMSNWDRYPTHAVYVQMMNDFVTNYPDICTLEIIGQSENGVDLICIKISDNVNTDEDEPEFFWTHTMHGDEVVAYI